MNEKRKIILECVLSDMRRKYLHAKDIEEQPAIRGAVWILPSQIIAGWIEKIEVAITEV